MKSFLIASTVASTAAATASLRGGEATQANFLSSLLERIRGESPTSVSAGNDSRKLIYDVDKSKICFQDDTRTNGVDRPHDADYYLNPFLANNDRGDWGKCMPEEVFGVLCVHENVHLLNDGSWTPAHGALHDELAEQMFLSLQRLHDDYCVHVDIELTDAMQQRFNDFYFARGDYKISGSGGEIGTDINMVVTAAGGKQYINGVSHPALVLYRGMTYTFDLTHHSNVHHPFSIGTADGTAYIAGVTVTDSIATFVVPHDAPDTLVYYCTSHLGMGNAIAVHNVDNHGSDMARKLMEEHDHSAVTYEEACRTIYPGDPRMSLQMSVYCLVGFADQSVPVSELESPYTLSGSCNNIVRHHFENRLTEELVREPLRYCSQDVEADTCTVSATVDTGETCDQFCSAHKGLMCTEAAVSQDSDECVPKRAWSCSEPQEFSWKLMCTCGADEGYVAPAEEATVTAACATMMLPSDQTVNRFCDQDFEADTCTAVIDTRTAEMRSCSSFCSGLKMECVRAEEELWDTCKVDKVLQCDEVITSSDMLCTCASTAESITPPLPVAPDCVTHCEGLGLKCISSSAKSLDECLLSNGMPCTKASDIAYQLDYVCAPAGEGESLQDTMMSDSCANMLTYPFGPKPKTFCPPSGLTPVDVDDSCTSLIDTWRVSSDINHRTCNAYCESYPGMKCVGAGHDVDNSCVFTDETIDCATQDWGDLLCACAIDDGAMATVLEKAAEPVSNACVNMMLHPIPVSNPNEVCASNDLTETCSVVANVNELDVRSCDEYCGTFPGMECKAASLSQQGGCATSGAFSCSAVTTHNRLVCECGFSPASPAGTHLMTGPLFEKNAAANCPAYELSTTPNNDGNFYHLNENDRTYTKLTLTLDYNEEKADGSVTLADVASVRDLNNIDIDTYTTPHVEICDGYESHIRAGDPIEKCSFGHRTSPDSNCYGKVHGMDFDEASKACSARGGHLAKFDDAAEFEAVTSTFKNQRFHIGLRDYSANEWRWDGDESTEVVDPHSFDYVSFSTSERDDCVRVIVDANGVATMDSEPCFEKETYLCEGVTAEGATQGGDLLADEGGFCLWYVPDLDLYLPDDEQNGFSNTELAHFLQYHENKRSNYYVNLYDDLFSASIPGHAINEVNWDDLTLQKVGIDSNDPILDKSVSDDYFHCHFSPTNFGMSRIYLQQHMLERLYPGALHKHCFCGYKHLGNLVSRCDCTRSGDANGQCQTEHEKMLWEETYHETGQYVFCNNGQCNGQSP